jgi:hypothetical protein
MDGVTDDDDSWWQQQDHEEQLQVEILARGRHMLDQFRRDNAQYDTDMKALTERVRDLCKAQ